MGDRIRAIAPGDVAAVAEQGEGVAAIDMLAVDPSVQRRGLGDCLWHVYAMIGKLVRPVYLLSAPAEMDGSGPRRATVEP